MNPFYNSRLDLTQKSSNSFISSSDNLTFNPGGSSGYSSKLEVSSADLKPGTNGGSNSRLKHLCQSKLSK